MVLEKGVTDELRANGRALSARMTVALAGEKNVLVFTVSTPIRLRCPLGVKRNLVRHPDRELSCTMLS